MKCEVYQVLLEKLLDGSLTDTERAQMAEHEASCADCAALRAKMESLQDDLVSLGEEVPPMPEELHAKWADAIRKERPMRMNQTERESSARKRIWPRAIAAVAALVFVIGGTILTQDELNPPAAGTAKTSSAGYARNPAAKVAAPQAAVSYAMYDANEDVMEEAEYAVSESADAGVYGFSGMQTMAAGGENGAEIPENEGEKEAKIVRNVSLNITSKAFDESYRLIEEACKAAGGWVSWSSMSENYNGLHTANLTLRIPSGALDSFLAQASGIGRITYRDESVQDMTESYYDVKTRLETQQALMARLKALVTDAADLSDLLELESQIAQTQYTIDSLQGKLNSTDRKVAYSTVSINLQEERPEEVVTDPERTFGERLTGALSAGFGSFVHFLSSMALFLVAALPYLAIVAVAVLIIALVRRRMKKA